MPWVADNEAPKKGWVVDNDPRATAGYQTAKATVARALTPPEGLPQPVRGFLQRAGDKAAAVVQGAGMEWADEAAGKVAEFATGTANAFGAKMPFTPREAGAATRDAINERGAAYAQAHPVENITAKLAGGAVTGRMGSGAVQGARTLGGAVAASAAVGGAYGAVTGAGAADGGLRGRAKGAAYGGATGAALGAATPIAVRGYQEVAARLPGRMADEGAALRQADEALQSVGINVRSLSSNAQTQLRGAIRAGRDPREAALAVVANTELRVPVPMTRGDRSGEPGQQLSENLMLRGQRGSAAARQMRGIRSEQQDALRGNVEAIGGAVAGGQLPARGQGVQAAAERLAAMRQQAEGGVDAAYNAARAVGGDAMLPSGQGPRDAVLGALRENYDLRNIEPVAREVETLGRDGAPTVRDLFDTRRRLTNLTQGDAVVGGAASRAVKALDAHIDQAVDADLFLGDPKAVKAWKEAIGARREFGKMFESGDLIEKLTAPTFRGGEVALKVDPGDAANYILGRSDLGFVGRQNLHRDLARLRGVLGPDSPEWNGVRGEVFGRLASAAEGGVEGGTRQFSGVKFAKAWSDLNRRDPNLAKTLFTAQERAEIDLFAGVAARVTSSVRGGDNPSNTAVAAARMLGNLRFLKGLPFVKQMTDEIEVQVNLGAARAATNPTPARVQRPRPTGNPFAVRPRQAP